MGSRRKSAGSVQGFGISVDREGDALDGENKYRIRFRKEDMSPFKQGGFWSIVLYYEPRMSVPENAIKRYKTNDLSPLSVNDDGTVDIYMQKDDPGEKWSQNWLPTVDGEFQFVLRIYAPGKKAVEGKWLPSYIEKVL